MVALDRLVQIETKQSNALEKIEKMGVDLAADIDLGKFLEKQMSEIITDKIPGLKEKLSQFKKVY